MRVLCMCMCMCMCMCVYVCVYPPDVLVLLCVYMVTAPLPPHLRTS